MANGSADLFLNTRPGHPGKFRFIKQGNILTVDRTTLLKQCGWLGLLAHGEGSLAVASTRITVTKIPKAMQNFILKFKRLL